MAARRFGRAADRRAGSAEGSGWTVAAGVGRVPTHAGRRAKMPTGRTAAPPRDDSQRETALNEMQPNAAHMQARPGSQTQAQGSIRQRSQAPAPPASERRAELSNAPAL